MNTWSLSWHGLVTVVDLEVRQRLRSKRWLWGLLVWFLFIGAVTGLIIYSMYQIGCSSYGCRELDPTTGPVTFGIVTLFVMGMALIVTPAFSATAINTDRMASTLATLQATKLSSLEIVAGKLVAAWLSAAVFLVAALPFIVLSTILGNISAWQVAVCFTVVFILVAVVCAIGLGWSAVFTRTAASTVMTYLSVAVISIISPLVMVMSFPFLDERQTIQIWGLTETQWKQYNREMDDYYESGRSNNQNPPAPPVDQCQWVPTEESVTRFDRVWWLLIPNPVVVVADAAPLTEQAKEQNASDVFSAIRYTVREIAMPPVLERDECIWLYNWNPAYKVIQNPDGTYRVETANGIPVDIPPSPVKPRPPADNYPVWPWGLAVNF
ncbi:MAG: ABC transporter permease, partial [Propionibacteriaceae bacterium]|nr:ABC transporter permease [Propionibacteriaceae bacterium]